MVEEIKIGPLPFKDLMSAESYFFTTLSIIAGNHGCKIGKVDLGKNIVELEGPEDKKAACAIEVVEKLSEYLA